MMFWPKSPCRIPADGITKHMRCLLVWLSIANSIHCTADFVGALWYYRVVQEKANPQHHLHGLCLAQALVCVFGLGFRVFGETGHLYSGPWCWIKKGLPQGWKIFWISVAGVAPEAPQEADTLQDADRTFFCVVWIIFYVFRVPGTINFILEIAYPGSHKEQLNYIKNVLMGMEAFGDDAQAFGNLVFLVIFNKEVRAWLSCKRNCVRPRNARDERSSLIQSTDNHAEPV
ncbi:hypothetical protein MAR_018071 [Mya arenaria]|uniref:Uncharacterized protein n=1 Tax=Mya arenaria TaxID=6604 RepID=A0ABY7EDM7_MYAAR|nr:hypothetical protein MAR_018071 [Mya arenaria]